LKFEMQIAFIARKHARNIFKAFENRLIGVAAIGFLRVTRWRWAEHGEAGSTNATRLERVVSHQKS